jgi:UDP-glucose:glycoprotein glucosyltransferase
MPSVRRDIHNAIVPIDFTDPKAARLLVDTIQGIIKRRIPLRWGVVPVSSTAEGEKQAKIIYHLQDSYGLVPVMNYLQKVIASAKRGQLLSPSAGAFVASVNGRDLKEGKTALSFDDLLQNAELHARLEHSQSYLGRLGVRSSPAPMFVNGVAVKQDDDWLQVMSQQVTVDLRTLQQGVFERKFGDADWLPEVFLNQSSLKRNPIVIPENDKDITLLNLPTILRAKQGWADLPRIPVGTATSPAAGFQVILVADFGSPQGSKLAANAIRYRAANDSAQLVFVHNPGPSTAESRSQRLFDLLADADTADLGRISEALDSEATVGSPKPQSWHYPELVASLRFKPGECGVVFNGRKLEPIPAGSDFTEEDFAMLAAYEGSKRHGPAYTALTDLELDSKIASVGDVANLCSVLSLSTVSDIPEGIFEQPPLIRTDIFHHWSDLHTAVSVGDNSTAVIHLVVALDPASETAQRWVPILKAVSQLDGVFVKIYLNPKSVLEELPVKRFYRYVVESAPTFANGRIQDESAEFKGIPSSALLTVGMDVPAAWLVTAKESLHDLDNIKLNTLPRDGQVDATYELEYILIEGHSRDTTVEAPPAGVQLALSTDKDPLYADTIIMSNLGYFQFKANPGHYSMNLKAGRSRDLFKLDSVGAAGYEAQPGDQTAEVTLLSFQGATLYPRLSRVPGKEEENILETEPAKKTPDFVQQGANIVGNLLNMAGIKKEKPQGLSPRALNLLTKPEARHADINIFSVASGHLYERMLNIMMVSVMRHTNQTVKFWFIEQFLSPSFKEFVPIVAKEYGFQYEMVTYKWPHWLRAQKEKQREIWGYKILFLDVLFPLDLDKVIFVDADQIVRTDMAELTAVDLQGAPYGFTPMCDSRVEMEGFRFWKQGYWKNFLGDLPYHISALYVVDLKRFRQLAAGDRLRQQYHQLSADPGSLSNLDQDLPNNMQSIIPIHSLDQNWLWCETWCSDASLEDAKTIDLCNNPLTKEPKLERARRQVPEWTEYDDEIAALARRTRDGEILTGNIQEDELFGKASPEAASADDPKSADDAKSADKDEL